METVTLTPNIIPENEKTGAVVKKLCTDEIQKVEWNNDNFSVNVNFNMNVNVVQNVRTSSNLEQEKQQLTSSPELSHALLLHIFKYLDVKSLFSCRLSSKKWNILASQTLQDRPEHKIHFVYDNLTHHFNMKKERENESANTSQNITLSDLTEFIKSHPNFPYASFIFEHELLTQQSRVRPVMKLKELKEFLKIFGPRIKSLSLINGRGQTRKQENFHVKAFQEILQRTPNIQYLDIKDWHHAKTTISLDNSKLHGNFFQNLRVLITNYNSLTPPSILQTILQCSKNLIKCEDGQGQGFVTQDLQLFSSLEKLHVIRGLSICPDEENMVFLEKIADSDLKLTSLSIYLNSEEMMESTEMKNRVSAIINKIFKSSKNTLISMDLEPLGFLEGIKFPIFSRLRSLLFYGEMTNRPLKYTFFPMNKSTTTPSLSLAQIFPHVQNVAFNFEEDLEIQTQAQEDDNNGNWNILFPPGNSIPSVEKIEITNVQDPTCFRILARLFPKTKIFIFQNPNYNFPAIASELWRNMTSVELLKLRIDDKGIANCLPFAIDSAFLGFSIETCERLHEMTIEELCAIPREEVERMRERPSILNLENLTFTGITLHSGAKGFPGQVHLRVGNGKFQLKKDQPLLSKLTGIFAFKLMEKLEPNICVHRFYGQFSNEIEEGYKTYLGPFVNRLRFF